MIAFLINGLLAFVLTHWQGLLMLLIAALAQCVAVCVAWWRGWDARGRALFGGSGYETIDRWKGR